MDEFIDMLLPDTTYNHGQSVSDMNIWRKPAWATVPYLDETKIPDLASKVKKAGIYVTPTNFFFISTFGQIPAANDITGRKSFQFLPVSLRDDNWKARDMFIKMQIPVDS